MKIAIEVLSLVLAMVLITSSLSAYKLTNAAPISGINFEVQPVTNTAAATPIDLWNLEILNTTTVGQTFNVTVHLTNATVENAPQGVAGIEIHIDFTPLLAFASIVGLTDYLGQAGGALNAPVLEALTGAIYKADGVTEAPGPLFAAGVQYIVAGASTGAPWNGADGLVVSIEFRINVPPLTIYYPIDPVEPLTLTFTDLDDPVAVSLAHGEQSGTITFQRTAFTYPPRPYIFIDPASNGVAIGQVFDVNVKINADSYWDIAIFDVTVEYNSTIITLLNATEGGFLKQGGATTFGFYVNTSNSMEAIFTKTSNPVPSSGIDTLFTLQFKVTCHFSHQPLSCNLELRNTDLVTWPHPLISMPPWNAQITGADMPYDPRPVPTAEPYTHYTTGGTSSVNLGDINNDGIVNLQDLVSFAKAYGSNPGSPNWNERADLAPPFGQISLTDLVTFAVYYNNP